MAQKFSSRVFPLEVGQVVSIEGRASKNAKRFDIDLMTGNRTHEDPGHVYFQFSVRFGNPGEIIRNSMIRNVEWGKDEKQENLIACTNANPIKAGDDFKISFYIGEASFIVSIDGKPFCTFAHRMPFVEIQRIVVAGDVEKVFHLNHAPAKSVQRTSNEIVLSGSFPKPLKPGSIVVLSGIPKGVSGDFDFNLANAESKRLFIHLKPNIKLASVVINDQDDKKNWRTQVDFKPKPFPFTIDHSFKLAIAIGDKDFKIATQGQIIATFPFRDDSRDVFNHSATYHVNANNGLKLEVLEIDHFSIAANCNGFERFTKK